MSDNPDNIIPFSFDGNLVRAVIIDGVPFFVGKDVAERLGYADPTNAIKQHCKGVVKRHPLQTAGGIQEIRVIAEPDVLRLIIGSKLPAAQQFEKWVFEEVLPAIRKTGGYKAPGAPEFDIPKTLPEALRLAANLAETVEKQAAALETAETTIAAKDLCIAEQAPKVDFYETLASAVNVESVNVVAKMIGTGQNRLFAFLRDERILRWDNVPYQVYIDKKYFEVIPKTFKGMGLSKEANFYSKTHVTGKGVIFITNLWFERHPEEKGRRMARA